jgi:hypothetical protein
MRTASDIQKAINPLSTATRTLPCGVCPLVLVLARVRAYARGHKSSIAITEALTIAAGSCGKQIRGTKLSPLGPARLRFIVQDSELRKCASLLIHARAFIPLCTLCLPCRRALILCVSRKHQP